jgi:hypothetical protein
MRRTFPSRGSADPERFHSSSCGTKTIGKAGAGMPMEPDAFFERYRPGFINMVMRMQWFLSYLILQTPGMKPGKSFREKIQFNSTFVIFSRSHNKPVNTTSGALTQRYIKYFFLFKK